MSNVNLAKFSVPANKKAPAFSIGDKVIRIGDSGVREVIWAGKGKTRGEQVISTDYDPLQTVEAELFILSEDGVTRSRADVARDYYLASGIGNSSPAPATIARIDKEELK